MLGKPATTNFTNRDVVAAMKLLESMHAGNSGGYYMMLEKNPAQAYGRVPEPDYSEVVYAGDTAEAPGPAQPKPDAWSSNLPDLRGLPQPIRAPPPRTEEEQEEEREQEQEEQREAEPRESRRPTVDNPLRNWVELVRMSRPAAPPQEAGNTRSAKPEGPPRVRCTSCAARGSKTFIREGATCWLCGQR
uniref:Uncharacterized protein n=1 Tax=Alexandrium monilatum TaxID=311494 RepID=A0A7S4SAD4_9DINO